ncbi:MAG: glycosyltransferase family A protein [Thermaerobacter sp.]|nr:glycosyltransferase family A protein [Thermaerobacter sp.]
MESPSEQSSPASLVGVVIPCYNYGSFLEEAVRSVEDQTIGRVAIVVVDDGSDDAESLRVLAGLRGAAQILRQANRGPSAARNAGIRALATRYACCLDADDALEPTYLEKAVSILEAQGVDLAYSWVQAFGDAHWVFRTEPLDLGTMLSRNQVSGHAVFRRAAWAKAGGYDEALLQGHEDWELWTHLAALGCRGVPIPEPLLRYRRHGRTRVFENLAHEEEFLALLRARYGGR